jgi:hypothetical protein
MTADREAAIREAMERDDKMAVSVSWLRGAVNELLAELAAAREREQVLREALRRISDEWAHRTPGVNPDGTVSTSSMAQTIARAALDASERQE